MVMRATVQPSGARFRSCSLLFKKEEEEEGHLLAKVAGILLVLFSFFTKITQASVRTHVEIVSSVKQRTPILRKYHSIFEDLTRVYYEVQEAIIDCDLNC